MTQYRNSEWLIGTGVILIATGLPHLGGVIGLGGVAQGVVAYLRTQRLKPATAPVTPARDVPLDEVQFSVYQGEEGPTVTTVTSGGEVWTKVFPSWPSASRFVAKQEALCKADGIRIVYLKDPI